MKEQEACKKMLKKMIVKTERDQIKSSDQLIKALISELINNNLIGSNKVETEPFAN